MSAKHHYLGLLAILLVSGSLTSNAQNVDAAAQIQGLLNKYGKVPYTHLVPHPTRMTSCQGPGAASPPICVSFVVSVNKLQTDQVILTPSNIKIISAAPVTMGPLTTTSLPTEPVVDLQEFVNCASVTNNQGINLAVAFTRSTSLQISHSVTNTASYSTNFGIKVSVFSFGGSLTFGNSATDGQIDTKGTQMTVTRTSTMNVTLAQNQSVAAKLEVWPVVYTQDFQTTVTIDADLSPNDKFHHLSEIYPDPASRTFPVGGTITITDGSNGVSQTYNDPTLVCKPGQNGVIKVDSANPVLVPTS
jgi:hypothetical protein